MKDDIFYLDQSIVQAKKALAIQEVPVGAVLVDEHGAIVAKAYNKVEKNCSQLAHAEMLVIAKAARRFKQWRLQNMTLYVTLQPCLMCLGALCLSRVNRVVYGAQSPKFGATIDALQKGSIYKNLNMRLDYIAHGQAQALMKLFFQKKRSEKNDEATRSGKNQERASGSKK